MSACGAADASSILAVPIFAFCFTFLDVDNQVVIDSWKRRIAIKCPEAEQKYLGRRIVVDLD